MCTYNIAVSVWASENGLIKGRGRGYHTKKWDLCDKHFLAPQSKKLS